MVPPVAVSPLIKTARWSALFLGMLYGKQRFEYLAPIAAEERKIEEAEKATREEQERIAKALAEASTDTILKMPSSMGVIVGWKRENSWTPKETYTHRNIRSPCSQNSAATNRATCKDHEHHLNTGLHLQGTHTT
ncbi:unnamed protein product [Arctogadus glacialis]